MITRSRTSSEVANAVAALPSAGLAEVTEQAALQVRIDRKYMVPVERFVELIVRLPQGYAVLEVDGLRGFAYESVYFDTPDLLTYRQHLQGRRRRYKVRTRAYLDTADCVFEVKLKGPRDRTVKAQLPYSLADRTHITPPARAFLVDRLEKAYGQSAPRLAARVTTVYRRTTLVDLDRGTRLTCDVDLAYIGNGRRAVGPSQYVLVESKGVAPHRDADATLRRLGLRPIQMSNTASRSRCSSPDVRSDPWHRTLRHYFADPCTEHEDASIPTFYSSR